MRHAGEVRQAVHHENASYAFRLGPSQHQGDQAAERVTDDRRALRPFRGQETGQGREQTLEETVFESGDFEPRRSPPA